MGDSLPYLDNLLPENNIEMYKSSTLFYKIARFEANESICFRFRAMCKTRNVQNSCSS